MKIHLFVFASLISTSIFGMYKPSNQIPPAKTFAEAGISKLKRVAGLEDVDTDETKKLLSGTAHVTQEAANVHDLMQDSEFRLHLIRAANRIAAIDAALIDGMGSNNPARVRALLELRREALSFPDLVERYLQEEIAANKEIVDPKGK